MNIKKIFEQTVGFTLAELLMVVVILGIMSAVAIPQFGQQKAKAYVSEAVGMLAAIRTAELGVTDELGRLFCNPVPDVPVAVAGGACSWAYLGMASPDADDAAIGTRDYWDYTIVPSPLAAGLPGTFIATATRQPNRLVGTEAAGQIITINQLGIFAGDHPNVPQ